MDAEMEFLLGIFAGLSLPIQTSLNAELRRHIGSPYLAILVSFIVAWVFLAALFAFGKSGLSSPGILGCAPWWIFSGGAFGVVFLVGNILLFLRLGGTLAVILPILGQILAGFCIDSFGLFQCAQIPVTANRALGILAVTVGASFAVIDLEKSPVSSAAERNVSWKLFGVLVGMSSAMQTAINGRLGVLLHSPLEASLVSFSVGIFLLTLVCLVLFFTNKSSSSPSRISPKNFRGPWWMLAGGILGALFILANIFLVKRIGAGLSIASTTTGMILGGLAIDSLGLFHAPVKRIRGTRILGIAILAAGILGIKFG